MAPKPRSLVRCWLSSVHAAAIVLVSLFCAPAARAQSVPSLVVVLTAEPSSQAARRLARDLESLGLDVLVLRATPENSSGRASLEKSARSVGAIAAVRLVVSGQGTEVWVADRITGKTVIRELVGSTDADVRPDDVALGAIELLRASLMELHSPTSPRGDAELTNEVRALAYPGAERPRPKVELPPMPAFSLSGGPSIDLGLGLEGVGPSLHSKWAAWVGLGQRIGARAFASLALLPGQHEIAEGTVEVASNVLGLGATFDCARPDGPLVPVIGLGFVTARVETVGRARAPFVSTSESAWFAGGYGELGLGWRITPSLRLRLDAALIALATRPTIEASHRVLGKWGAPGGLVALGVEVLLFK
jgi:hypothetical protein